MTNERFIECLDCNTKSNKALWIGKAELADGREIHIEGIVGFDGDTEYLDLDPLLNEISEEVEGCEGDYYCISCKSQSCY